MTKRGDRRHTAQHLLPVRKPPPPDAYDVYPTYPLGETIHVGVPALAERLAGESAVLIDGYLGVFWEDLRADLDRELRARGVQVRWIDVASAMRPRAEIDALVGPYLGGDDPLFGTICPHNLADLFQLTALAALAPDVAADLTVVYGCGAALCGWDAVLVYVDLPKNELQYRARAGTAGNLGIRPGGDWAAGNAAVRATDDGASSAGSTAANEQVAAADAAKAVYKHFYFVDWPILNRHKRDVLPDVDWFVDGQRPGRPTFAPGRAVRSALGRMARSHARARPWFEPGAWGGQWLRRHIPQLASDVPNYAWSFELITPENGVLLEHESVLLEVSFDLLLYHDAEAVLGRAWPRFGHEFPIRFNLLDTVGGGNLSVQVHPQPEYIREHYGENFTQDETYYVLDCEQDARVFLGFRDDARPDAFRAALERSRRDGIPVDVPLFVHSEPSERHRLYLIPSGTVHSSGAGNLVLEISATPYIFTFKLYDWQRRDLDGRPRPLNIERGFDNLDFGRTARIVQKELTSQPTVVGTGDDWSIEHLPTHREHFYDVRRYTFASVVDIDTEDDCHVMSVVAGDRIRLETREGPPAVFHYAETFIVPAAAGSYRLVNEGTAPAVVVQAYVKQEG